MSTNQKELLPSFNVQKTKIDNPITTPAIDYSKMVDINFNSMSFDYTGTTVNKFLGDKTYGNTFIVNYTTFN